MLYLFRSMCVLAWLTASPLSVGAQAEAEGKSAEPNAEKPVQSAEPTRSRLERWHPEAFVDPTKSAPQPELQLEVDSASLEVTPTAPPTVEELEREEAQQRRRRVAIGVGVSLGVAALIVGVALGVSAGQVNRSFDRSGTSAVAIVF